MSGYPLFISCIGNIKINDNNIIGNHYKKKTFQSGQMKKKKIHIYNQIFLFRLFNIPFLQLIFKYFNDNFEIFPEFTTRVKLYITNF